MKIEIHWMCGGWCVLDDKGDVLGEWDHNDSDMGTKGIKDILTKLGYDVEVVEVY